MNEEVKNKYKKILLEKNITKLLKIIDDPNIKLQNDKKKIIKQVHSLIKEYWSDIELISHFLIQKKKISFNQIKEGAIKKNIEGAESWSSCDDIPPLSIFTIVSGIKKKNKPNG